MKGEKTSILFPVLLTVPLLALVFAIATQSPALSTAAKAIDPPLARAIYRTTAAELYRDYNRDAAATTARIGSGRILISGTVVGVSHDYLGQNLVLLDAGNGISTTDMTLAANQNPLTVQLQRGQAISMFCDQMQRYSDAPTGSDCTLIEPPVASHAQPTPRPVSVQPGIVSLNDRDGLDRGPALSPAGK